MGPPILDSRSSQIFCRTVEAYIETGAPVGSKTLSERLHVRLSPATIRNVMGNLEALGLLTSPHTSAGRIPTAQGLRLFIDHFLTWDDVALEDQKYLDDQLAQCDPSEKEIFEQAALTLSGLFQCAGLMVAPQSIFKHVEFIRLNENRTLVVMVPEEGLIENYIIEIPSDFPNTILEEATRYMNQWISGKTLQQARQHIAKELNTHQAQLDALTAQLIQKSLKGKKSSPFIVRGQSHLLRHVWAGDKLSDLEDLLTILETQEALLVLLDQVMDAQAIQVFIDSPQTSFNGKGCAVILAPYYNGRGAILGALGVVGPLHMPYARIIPFIKYTAKRIGDITD